MKNQIIAWILLYSGVLQGSVLTVCASGCTTTSLQTAWDSAASGDTINVTTGYVVTENVILNGNISGTVSDKNNITIQTNQYPKLPSDGWRVSETHIPFMFQMTPTTLTLPTVSIGYENVQVALNGVDISLNTITFEIAPNTSSGLANGAAVVFSYLPLINGSLPAPLVSTTIYYIINWNGGTRTGQVSLTRGGSVIDLTTVGSAGNANYYARPAAARVEGVPKNLTINGMYTYDGNSQGQVIRVGGVSYSNTALGPTGKMIHSFMTGDRALYTRPITGMAVNDGMTWIVRDSVIEGMLGYNGADDSAVAGANIDGLELDNNYLSATSITFLTGGADVPTQANPRGVRVVGNYFDKPGWMHFRYGTGAPTGACYYGGRVPTGGQYRDTSVGGGTAACTTAGACYECDSSSVWQAKSTGTVPILRWSSKTNLELKNCEDCLVEGNVFEGQSQSVGEAGQSFTMHFSVIVSPSGGGVWGRVKNTMVKNNYGYRNWTGLGARNAGFTGDFTDYPIQNSGYENNINTEVSQYPQLCESTTATPCAYSNSTQPTHFLPASGAQGISFNQNTLRGYSNGGYIINLSGPPGMQTFNPFRSKNNLIQFDFGVIASAYIPINADGSPSSCTGAAFTQYGTTPNGMYFDHDVFATPGTGWGLDLTNANCASYRDTPLLSSANPVFAGTPTGTASNSRLQVTSPYSVANGGATHLASDGASMGAWVDMVEQLTIPARAGTPSYPSQLGVKVTRDKPSGAATIRVRNRWNGAALSCTETVWSNRALTTQVDTQTGSTGSFSLTGLTGAQYWYKVDCASSGMYAVGMF